MVNPRTSQEESLEALVARVQEILKYLPPEHLFLNPACGFGTVASRTMNPPETASRKLAALAAAAALLRASVAAA